MWKAGKEMQIDVGGKGKHSYAIFVRIPITIALENGFEERAMSYYVQNSDAKQ